MRREKWVSVRGWDDSYSVSTFGRVASVARTIMRKDGRPMPYPYKIMVQCLKSKTAPYLCVNLWKGGESVQVFVHRLVAEAFIPNPEGKEFVNHKDGVKTNNNVDNLEWVTREENEKHALENGLKNSNPPRGVKNGMAKLTEEDVLNIDRRLKNGEVQSVIAASYGVHQVQISRINLRKDWRHILCPKQGISND